MHLSENVLTTKIRQGYLRVLEILPLSPFINFIKTCLQSRLSRLLLVACHIQFIFVSIVNLILDKAQSCKELNPDCSNIKRVLLKTKTKRPNTSMTYK